MKILTLAEVADLVGGRLAGGAVADDVVAAVTIDSRAVSRSALFVALRGNNADGHDHAEAAVAAGAVAVLASRPVRAPSIFVDDTLIALGRLARGAIDRLPEVTVIGLTGSSGKTTTKDLLAQVLAAAGPTVAPVGSYNNEIGVPLTVLSADDATRHLVVEMGARGAGHISYLCGLAPPRIGLVLNVGSAHIGEFGTVAGIAAAKRELVEALPPGADGGIAVLNADDPMVASMAAATAARVVTFGRARHADVRAEHVSVDAAVRASFDLRTIEGAARVELRLHGEHNVSNALGAGAVARELGMDLAAVARALSNATPRSRWRMEVTDREDGVTIINDAYNANPGSVQAAVEALAAMGAGRRRTWAVLGEMLELGAASADEHAAVGRLAMQLNVSRLVVVGAGAEAMFAAARQSRPDPGEGAVFVTDVDDAVALLHEQMRSDDVVLIKASRGAGLERIAAALLGDSR